MNRRRRWKAKHRRVQRKRQDHSLVTDVSLIREALERFRDDPDPKKQVPAIVVRPPARLRKRANSLIGRVYRAVYPD